MIYSRNKNEPDYDRQFLTAQQHPPEVEANQVLLFEQTNGLSSPDDFLHSNKQENNVSSPNLPAYIIWLQLQASVYWTKKEKKKE